MMHRSLYVAVLALTVAPLIACDNLPGRPKSGEGIARPEEELSFKTLYAQNCAGCHGADGQKGPGTNLANPEYEALVDDSILRDVIAKGQKDTMMPAFAKSAGGALTDQQIDAIVRGMRSQWFKGNVLDGQNAPPYKATKQGDPSRGQQVYSANCARCHGAIGGPPGPKGAILDSNFLALISDQTVRTTAIVGRADLGMPDWRKQMKDRVMTDQDITDVVSWLMSKRPNVPGQSIKGQQEPATPSGASK